MHYFMSSKWFNYRLVCQIVFVKRSVMIQSQFELAKQMKLLNDNGQFQRALELFDQQKRNSVNTFSSFVITQALKACANLKDLQRGLIIHQLIPSRTKDDSYILASLIHLYSKMGEKIILLLILLAFSAMWSDNTCSIII